MKKFAVILAVFFIAGVGGYWLYKKVAYSKEPVPAQVSFRDVVLEKVIPEEIEEVQADGRPEVLADKEDVAVKNEVVAPREMVKIPSELNLAAAFYAQAPFANWDYPWQEACEEASVLLVANEYFGHNWTRHEFNAEILDLVDWEVETFGAYEHTDVDQTVQILEDYLGLEAVVHEDPTFKDVQEILARGHLIVMTFAGKELGNPFFTNGGPMYHAMVIKGYKEGERIITHDVGTRRGEDYVYAWEVIEGALHDYAVPIQSGAKRMIEVLPPAESL